MGGAFFTELTEFAELKCRLSLEKYLRIISKIGIN